MDAPISIPPAGRKASAFTTLRGYATARRAAPEERCELCGLALAPEHRHLLEQTTRKILCSCDACGLRFENVIDGRFKLIPRDARALPDFQPTDSQWNALSLPINLAFFFYDSPSKKMTALYPSPAGATESLLPLSAWESLVADNPVLATLGPDVETLLVDRVGNRRFYAIAPIDVCFELVGLIRIHWRGLSGGEEVWREIEKFFVRLEDRARPPSPREQLLPAEVSTEVAP
jgi:hypothetical protein